MYLPQLANSCHLHPLTRATAVGSIDLYANLGQIGMRSFKRVSAAHAEHARNSF